MPPIRILVVDDAVVARTVISDILNHEDGLEVVGTAPNGRIALTKIARLRPDLVTLDIDMPELDGMATLERIRSDFPAIDVIMVSNLTQRGARVTVDALFLGAADYVTKATRTSSPESAREHLRNQLLPKIRALYLGRRRDEALETSGLDRDAQPATASGPRSIKIVAIGASTGGPNALADVLESIPRGFPAPVVIVQHMPKNFTAYLAQRLDSRSQLNVREATDGTILQPGDVWIAPGDLHIKVKHHQGRYQIATDDGPHVNSCRPSVDVLFRSVAACYSSSSLAVVLTGMGQDGLDGSRAITDAGGRIIVQDQASSVVWGMPGHVATAGLADVVLPPGDIGAEIVRRVGLRR
ncbi:MAG: chemotaxis response regulator protein-glutamate methylesterase [Candidatus Sulfomarinibacteraceae bacterium]